MKTKKKLNPDDYELVPPDGDTICAGCVFDEGDFGCKVYDDERFDCFGGHFIKKDAED